ncbi:hypothetical protein ACQ4PT_028607 [Festuca glaucescens]
MVGGAREAIVDSFMEVTSCDSQSTAVRHLSSCGWRLEAAINRYFTVGAADAPPDHPVVDPIPVRSETMHDDTVRDPIPARSDRLYQHEDFYGPGSSTARAAPSIWRVNREPRAVSNPGLSDEKDETNIAVEDERAKEAEEDHGNDDKEAMEEDDGAKSMELEEEDDGTGKKPNPNPWYSDDDQDNGDYLDAAETDHMEALEGQPPPRARADKTLDDLFRPPYEIMFQGSFHDAKVHAARKDQWLLINIQLSGVFASHLHNRDLWSNEVVAQVIKDSFVFSLLQKTARPGDEAGKVCCFYKLQDDQLPVVLVLDPITGQLSGAASSSNPTTSSPASASTPSPSLAPCRSKPRIVVRPIAAAATPQEPVVHTITASDSQEPAPAPKVVDKVEAPAAPFAQG